MAIPVAPAHTPKGERTRQHILDTALALFAEKGYERTTLRDIAAAAGCSLGLTYRYFTSKEALVLELYDQMAHGLSARMAGLPAATLAERFEWVMRAKLALVEPYRGALGAVFGAAANPQSGVAVLGGSTAGVRQEVSAVFAAVVSGATDAPPQPQASRLAVLLYSAHLALLLFWLHDRSAGSRATYDLLSFIGQSFGLATSLLELEPVSDALERLVDAISPVVGAGV